MRFGYWIGNSHTWSDVLASAQRAEETGWDGLWFADHFMPNDTDVSGPIHEVWSVLAGLAAVTSRVRLGPLVCGNTYRHPAVLAKQAVSADHIAGGRIVLGLGAGWQENEHAAYGLPFGTFTDRFERLEEALQILHGLRSGDRTSFSGRYYQLSEAPLEPKPVGPLPILIGGGGERKTLRLVARYADEWNVWSTPEVMAAKAKIMEDHCQAVGRDPGQIQRSAVALLFLCDDDADVRKLQDRQIPRPSLIGTPSQLQDTLGAFVEAGVDEVIIPDFNLGDPSRRSDIADRFLAEVAAPFRT
jgi:F420-dependent oxidoreductase-like protein